MTAAAPIQKRKLYQAVQDRLLQRIQAGEIPPGAQLPPERELMDVYGVGRLAVREALQALERSGIVEISHGERARVVVPDAHNLIRQMTGGARHLLHAQPETLLHLRQARSFLEEGTARTAALRATPADVADLRARIRAHQAALTQDDSFVQHDMGFHAAVARIGGNPIFPAIVEAIFQWASDHHRAMVRAPGAEQLTLAEHSRLVDAIEAGDPDAAAAAVQAHLARSDALYQHSARPDAPYQHLAAAPAAAHGPSR